MDEHTDLIWKALADPTRRRLLDLLRDGPRTTGALASAFEGSLSRFGVMKHLGILEAAGLVVVRRQGRQTWHHLNAVPLRRIYERWVTEYGSRWAGSLLRLKESVEAEPADITNEEVARVNHVETTSRMEIVQEVLIAAPSDRVFAALIDVDAWWSHSFSASPAGVRLEPTVGGRFFEEFANGQGGALYATVSYVAPGQKLRLSGPMGMRRPVLGVIEFELEPQGESTLLKLSHLALGDLDPETERNYREGWRDLLETHLKEFAERGTRLR